MKEEIVVKICQFDVRSAVDRKEAREENLELICDRISTSKENELIVFPELSISGYIREFDPEFRAQFWEKGSDTFPDGETFQLLNEAVNRSGCYAIVGFCENSGIKYECFDSAAFLGPKGVIGRTRKTHLPINEKHYFIPGKVGQVFNTPLGKIGMMICYDMSFPETARILAIRGAEIIVCISDWGGSHNQPIQWEVLPVTRAVENECHFVCCNRTGSWYIGPTRGNVDFIGKSKIVSAFGKVLAQGDENPGIISAVLTSADLRKGAQFLPVFRDRMPSLYADLTGYVSEERQ